jgi:hypothetical protein
MGMTSVLFLSLIGLLIMLISGHLVGMRKINKLLIQALKIFKQNGSPKTTCEGNVGAYIRLLTEYKDLVLHDLETADFRRFWIILVLALK